MFFLTHVDIETKGRCLSIYSDLGIFNNIFIFILDYRHPQKMVLGNSNFDTFCASWHPMDDRIILCQGDGTIHIYDIKVYNYYIYIQ